MERMVGADTIRVNTKDTIECCWRNKKKLPQGSHVVFNKKPNVTLVW